MRVKGKRSYFIVVALGTAAICGCTSDLEEQISELAKARQCWAMTRTRDYAFDLDTRCFGACYGPVTVEVELGDVVSVIPHEGRTPSSDDILEDVPRIGDLFDKVLHYIERSSQDGVELEVTYDPTYGYPRSIDYRNNNVTDLYFKATVDNVRMKQAPSTNRYDCGL